jgi:hypothetical protein
MGTQGPRAGNRERLGLMGGHAHRDLELPRGGDVHGKSCRGYFHKDLGDFQKNRPGTLSVSSASALICLISRLSLSSVCPVSVPLLHRSPCLCRAQPGGPDLSRWETGGLSGR